MYHPYYHSPANHPHSLNPIHPHIQPSGIPAMHLPFTPCSHAPVSSACFVSTPAPSVLLATTLTLSAFLNSVPSLILPSISPTFPYGRNVLSHNLLFDQRTFYDAALFLPTNKVSVLIKMNKRESAVFHGF